MKAAVNGQITIGIVTIPVGVASAVTSTKDPSFKNLHDTCHTPVSKRAVTGSVSSNGNGGDTAVFCKNCGVDVEPEQIVKGYEYAKGQLVYFTEDEMLSIKPERSPVIDLTKFVKAGEITQKMIEKTYFLLPNPNIADSYGVFYQALAQAKRVGVGMQTLWGKEHPCAVLAAEGVLMMWTLHIYEDLLVPDFETPVPKAAAATKSMAKEIITVTHAGSFDPEQDLASPARDRVKAAVEAKIEQRPIEVPGGREPVGVPDIQEALRREIASKQKKGAKAKT